MASTKLTNYVQININHYNYSAPDVARDTVVLFTEPTDGTETIPALNEEKTFYSLAEFTEYFPFSSETEYDDEDAAKNALKIYYYGYEYFKNGGIKLKVIPVEAEGTKTIKEVMIEEIKNLPVENIVIASTISITTGEGASAKTLQPYEVLNEIAGEINNFKNGDIVNDSDPYAKYFIACLPELDSAASYSESDLEEICKDINKGMILKYGTPGIEMGIGAYLSQINKDVSNSVQDYAFTIEKVEVSYKYKVTNGNDSSVMTGTYGKAYDDNDLVVLMNKYNINVVTILVNQPRVSGGNDMNGNDLVNDYMLIVLQQTLCESLVNLLTQKLKYNPSSLSLVSATVTNELKKYVENGYLSTNKTWDEDDLKYKGTTIITEGTLLKNGYKYIIFPFSTLNSEQKKNHELPEIFILIAENYSIRKIVISGDVF